MSGMGPPDPAVLKALAAAAYAITVEIWTLYAIGVTTTILRTYARVRSVGWRGLRADDYLVWCALLFYSLQSSLGYSIGNVAHGMANNGMTDEQRALLSPADPEYIMRVKGSKIQVAGWSSYSTLITLLKLSVLAFYVRLTDGLGRKYRIRINIGFALVLACYLACILVIFTACRPVHKLWQIYPNPGNVCQPALSPEIVWVSFASNILTDSYLLIIPLPMLWQSSLTRGKKIASTFVLGAGVFVLVCAALKSIFVLVDPANGAQLAGSWGIRETFTAVMTTNLPMIFPLFKSWLSPFLPRSAEAPQKNYRSTSGLRTVGGSARGESTSKSRSGRRGQSTSKTLTANPTFSESEERIVGGDIKMQQFKASAAAVGDVEEHGPGIMVLNQVDIVHEDRTSDHRVDGVQRVHGAHETW